MVDRSVSLDDDTLRAIAKVMVQVNQATVIKTMLMILETFLAEMKARDEK